MAARPAVEHHAGHRQVQVQGRGVSGCWVSLIHVLRSAQYSLAQARKFVTHARLASRTVCCCCGGMSAPGTTLPCSRCSRCVQGLERFYARTAAAPHLHVRVFVRACCDVGRATSRACLNWSCWTFLASCTWTVCRIG
jgi:hypothetical protein